MSKEDFYEQRKYWKSMDKTYIEKLKKKFNEEEYKIFHNVMDVMLKENAKLEQEAFLLY